MGGRAEAAERRGQAAVLGEALSGCPTLCRSPAARTAGDGGGHSCFHPAGEREGKSIPAVAGEPSGRRPRVGARSGAPTAKRTTNFALSSPSAAFMPQLRGRDCPRPPADTPARLAARRSPDAPRSGKVARSQAQRSRTPTPRRRSPRLDGPLALPAAAAPLTCIDAMMKPSPQGQRGPRRRGRSRVLASRRGGPTSRARGWSRRWEGAGVSDWLTRGCPGRGGEGRDPVGRPRYLAPQPIYTRAHPQCWRRRGFGLDRSSTPRSQCCPGIWQGGDLILFFQLQV